MCQQLGWAEIQVGGSAQSKKGESANWVETASQHWVLMLPSPLGHSCQVHISPSPAHCLQPLHPEAGNIKGKHGNLPLLRAPFQPSNELSLAGTKSRTCHEKPQSLGTQLTTCSSSVSKKNKRCCSGLLMTLSTSVCI